MQLLARGRAADVFDLGDGTVLRRYRLDHDCGPEAEVMRWAGRHGVPVPRVHSAEGTDMVLERLDGPTMLADLGARPWRVRRHARLLAALHRALDDVPAPAGLPTPYGPGGRLLHRDLHPDNVLLTGRGPVLIDWSNAAAGPRAADVAETWMLCACFGDVGGLLDTVGRRLLVGAFLAGVDRAAAAAWLPAVQRLRLGDGNITAAEHARVQRLVARQAS